MAEFGKAHDRGLEAPPASACSWPASTPEGPLEQDAIDVWCSALDRAAESLPSWERLLGTDELSRARRFHFLRDQRRYIVGRGVLRRMLARYLGCRACEIVFAYGDHGKPFLADSGSGLHFNLSHSQGMAVYAITRNRDIGVDLEAIRPIEEMESIARRFFTTGEFRRLLALPQTQRVEAFFNGWTRKEACLKALGAGIAGGLDAFEVTIEPGGPVELLHHPSGLDTLGQWELFGSSPAPGYVVALAARGKGLKPHWRQWQDLGGD